MDGSPGFPVTGTVVDVAADQVTLDHEEIPGVMPAMVMELAAAPAEIRDLHPGDRVTATMQIGSGPTRLEGVRVVGHVDPPAAPERRWDDSLLVGEVLEPVSVETTTGVRTVGAGQGQVTVVTFLFTRCPVPEFCPLLATKLAALQSRIPGARIVAVSLDPEHDSPEVLAAYGAQVGADPAVWVLGRVAPDVLTKLLTRVDVDVRPDGSTLTHNLRLLVLDPDGRLVHRERDNQWDVDTLAAVVQKVVRP